MHRTLSIFNAQRGLGKPRIRPMGSPYVGSLLALSTLFWGMSPQVMLAQVAGETIPNSSRFWDFNAQTHQLRLTLEPGVAPRYFLLARPMRIAIEFPAPEGVSPESFQYTGAVEQVIVSPQGNGNLRIILQLRSGVELQPKQVALQQIDPSRWLITPLLVDPSASAAISPSVLPTIPSGANSILEPRAVQSLPSMVIPQTPGVSTATNPNLSTVISPERSIPRPNVADRQPLTPQLSTPQPLTPQSSTPQPPSTGVPNNAWPTQTVELYPQPTPETHTPRSQTIVPNPVPVNPVTANTVIQTVPVPNPVTPSSVAARSEESSASEKPAPLATRPLVEVRETIAPTSPVSSVPAASISTASIPASRPSSRSSASPVQSSPVPAIVAPKVEPDRPAVTLSAVPLSPVPVAPLPTAITPPSRPVVPPTLSATLPETVPPLRPPGVTSQRTPQAQPIPKLEFGQPLPVNGSSPARPPVAQSPQNPQISSQGRSTEAPEITFPLSATYIPGSTAPIAGAIPTQSQADSPSSTILLAKGSPIPLRYTGTVPLQVAARENRQEVLIVDEDVKSPQGQVVIPGGSQVIGRFETNWRGSRFVAQAISLGSYNQSLEAKSNRLEGDRSPNPLSIGAGSGTGAIAGTLIAGGFGALGGAALGAVSGYFVSPQPTTLEPHQIVMVYLAEDWVAE